MSRSTRRWVTALALVIGLGGLMEAKARAENIDWSQYIESPSDRAKQVKSTPPASEQVATAPQKSKAKAPRAKAAAKPAKAKQKPAARSRRH